MIKAIFFAKFDVNGGPRVLHQVPNDSIVPSPHSNSPQPQPLFHFPSYSSYIIPRQTFCAQPISFCTRKHRVLGHPMCLTSPRYPRNEYIFNFCLVLPLATDATAYQSVASKLASLFHGLEASSRFLSREDGCPQNTGKVYALCEMLLEDLNNYCECMIPIVVGGEEGEGEGEESLNIKLFPTYPPPPPVSPHHVPLSTVRLESVTDDNWDLTMLLILPHVNGVNSIRQIALLADADYKLVRVAIEHLLYYGCVILLDVFGFGACYAPTAEMAGFVSDAEAQEECGRYVLAAGEGGVLGSLSVGTRTTGRGVEGTRLVELYCSLRQGQSLRSWCVEHMDVMGVVDIRRFITFGVIKGFLYRVHKYVIATSLALEGGSDGQEGGDKGKARGDPALSKYLEGKHCFDKICTDLMISEKELMVKLKAYNDVHIIQR